jgi:hypothetical protein
MTDQHSVRTTQFDSEWHRMAKFIRRDLFRKSCCTPARVENLELGAMRARADRVDDLELMERTIVSESEFSMPSVDHLSFIRGYRFKHFRPSFWKLG